VEQSKTDAGVREVDVQPELHDELVAWRAKTPFDGRDDLVFPTRTGGVQNRHNVRRSAGSRRCLAGLEGAPMSTDTSAALVPTSQRLVD